MKNRVKNSIKSISHLSDCLFSILLRNIGLVDFFLDWESAIFISLFTPDY